MKLIPGVHYYRDPVTGADVWTARYLAERGFCCNGGCRHCPYGTDGVTLVSPQPLLEILPEEPTGE